MAVFEDVSCVGTDYGDLPFSEVRLSRKTKRIVSFGINSESKQAGRLNEAEEGTTAASQLSGGGLTGLELTAVCLV
jgi:hypothetical protein